ncbi:MAG: hypothetical protein LBH25_01095 [Fibromonadaceae bacterium]|jgi:uncharacterized protein (TIGR02145 family)|nr:hypothetical protein [Fibromonadaceae bacterium]
MEKDSVMDRRDCQLYRTIRCGQFWYEGQLYELEWLAEDLRYESYKGNRHRLGVPAKHGRGRMYSLEDLNRWDFTNPARTEGCDSYFVPFHGKHLIDDRDADGLADSEKELAEKRKAVNDAYGKLAADGDSIAQCRDSLEDRWNAAGLPASDLADLNAVMRQLNSQASELSDTREPFEQGRIYIWEINTIAEAAQGTIKAAQGEALKTGTAVTAFVGKAISDVRITAEYLTQAKVKLFYSLEKLNATPPEETEARKDLNDTKTHLMEAINKLSDIVAKLEGRDGSLLKTKYTIA